MPAGEYCLDTSNAGDALQYGHPWLSAASAPWPPPPQVGGPLDDLLIVRPGGTGDIIFLGPLAREAKRLWPGVRVRMCVAPPFAPVAAMVPEFDELVEYPPTRQTLEAAGAVIWLENSVEFCPEADAIHIIDAYAARAGFPVPEKRLHLEPGEGLRRQAADEAAGWRGPRPRIAIQVQASSRLRTYPERLLNKAANTLHRQGCTVIFFGTPGSNFVVEEKGVINGPGRGWPLGLSIALLEQVDCVLAPDSGLFHAAIALGKPAVGLYGPFDPATRVSAHGRVSVVTGEAECAPCAWHSRISLIWPPECHGWKHGECKALAAISPAAAVEAVWKCVRGED